MKIEEIEFFISNACKFLKTEKPILKIRKEIKGGLCFHDKKEIHLPESFLDLFIPEGFILWTILHETCHLVSAKHTNQFFTLEDNLCKQWGIRIVRKCAYPKELYYNGRLVFKRD